jgi:hypothetical protein
MQSSGVVKWTNQVEWSVKWSGIRDVSRKYCTGLVVVVGRIAVFNPAHLMCSSLVQEIM